MSNEEANELVRDVLRDLGRPRIAEPRVIDHMLGTCLQGLLSRNNVQLDNGYKPEWISLTVRCRMSKPKLAKMKPARLVDITKAARIHVLMKMTDSMLADAVAKGINENNLVWWRTVILTGEWMRETVVLSPEERYLYIYLDTTYFFKNIIEASECVGQRTE